MISMLGDCAANVDITWYHWPCNIDITKNRFYMAARMDKNVISELAATDLPYYVLQDVSLYVLGCWCSTALDSKLREGGYRRVRMTSWLKLTSQTAVITGAASGIGRGMLRNHLFNNSAFMLNDESHLLSKQLLLQPRPLHSRSKGKQLH